MAYDFKDPNWINQYYDFLKSQNPGNNPDADPASWYSSVNNYRNANGNSLGAPIGIHTYGPEMWTKEQIANPYDYFRHDMGSGWTGDYSQFDWDQKGKLVQGDNGYVYWQMKPIPAAMQNVLNSRGDRLIDKIAAIAIPALTGAGFASGITGALGAASGAAEGATAGGWVSGEALPAGAMWGGTDAIGSAFPALYGSDSTLLANGADAGAFSGFDSFNYAPANTGSWTSGFDVPSMNESFYNPFADPSNASFNPGGFTTNPSVASLETYNSPSFLKQAWDWLNTPMGQLAKQAAGTASSSGGGNNSSGGATPFSSILSGLGSYYFGQQQQNALQNAAQQTSFLNNPLNQSQRQPYQGAYGNLMFNPNSYQMTPYAQGQMNLLNQAFMNNVSKHGPSGTAFNDYIKNAQNYMSQDFFKLADQFSTAGGFNQGTANTASSSAPLLNSAATAGLNSSAGLGKLAADFAPLISKGFENVFNSFGNSTTSSI